MSDILNYEEQESKIVDELDLMLQILLELYSIEEDSSKRASERMLLQEYLYSKEALYALLLLLFHSKYNLEQKEKERLEALEHKRHDLIEVIFKESEQLKYYEKPYYETISKIIYNLNNMLRVLEKPTSLAKNTAENKAPTEILLILAEIDILSNELLGYKYEISQETKTYFLSIKNNIYCVTNLLNCDKKDEQLKNFQYESMGGFELLKEIQQSKEELKK